MSAAYPLLASKITKSVISLIWWKQLSSLSQHESFHQSDLEHYRLWRNEVGAEREATKEVVVAKYVRYTIRRIAWRRDVWEVGIYRRWMIQIKHTQ